ncbi:MAG: hypothetical protein ACM31L_07845 [Actinomycetota bacterium]
MPLNHLCQHSVDFAPSECPPACAVAIGNNSLVPSFKERKFLNAGGVAGALAGGVAGTAVGGPAGGFIGRLVGGAAGGMIASQIAGVMIPEKDRAEIFEVISLQIEYLSVVFFLTSDELDAVTQELENRLTKGDLERIFAHRNRRSAANEIIKPIVVNIVSRRPSFSYDMDDVFEACEEVAEWADG